MAQPDVAWAIWKPSPNKNPRNGVKVDTIVLHATAGPLEPSLNWLTNPNSGVSAHYLLGKDGTLYQLVEEQDMAWHAGASKMPPPDNREGVNWFSIGIEIENANTGHDPYPPAQIDALVRLLKDIVARHNIPRQNIVTHKAIAVPAGRKSDPAGLDVDALLNRVYEGQAPPTFTRNRPRIGLHARNDTDFTPADYEIIRRARIESLKTLSFLKEDVYRRCREINPNMEFIVRLYKHMPRGNVPSPQQFADEFRDVINRLFEKFGVTKFEVHNEPNHLTGLEGWGQTREDAIAFNQWYQEVFAILKARHPFALLGFPGLAVPHNDLEWLDWCRDSIEMSDWLGCHVYWQTPPDQPDTYKQEFWGLRFKLYHNKFPHKLIEITEFGNSNGQSGLPVSHEAFAQQYVWWLTEIQKYPYLGSAHAFIATSPDPQWARDGFTWADEHGNLYPIAEAVGTKVPRPPLPPEWGAAWQGFNPGTRLQPGERKRVTGTLINSGRRPWIAKGDTAIILIQRWLTPGFQVVGTPQYLQLPHDFAPSEQATIQLTLTAPTTPGTYLLRYDLYDKGNKKWLTQHGARHLHYTITVEPASAAPPLRVEWVSATVPGEMQPGQRVPITATVRNVGTATWRAGGEPAKGVVRLGYHWITADGREIEGKTRGVLPRDVAPGETVTLENVEILTPETPGAYTLRLDMVAEQVAWFRQVDSRPHTVSVRIQPPPAPPFRVEWVSATLPASIPTQGSARITVSVKNTGSATWRAGGEPPQGIVHLGYRWLTADGAVQEGAERGRLPSDVPPGGTATIAMDVRAPATPGAYTLRLDMVAERIAWFHEVGGQPLDRTVRVEGVSTSSPQLDYRWLNVQLPRQMRAGQTVRGRVVVQNTGSETWRARTPDGRGMVRLGYHWYTTEKQPVHGWPDIRAMLPNDVPPGNSVALDIEVGAPPQPGTYLLALNLVKEGVAWFPKKPEPPGLLTVQVLPAASTKTPWGVVFEAHTLPTHLEAGETADISLTLRNTGERPWQASGAEAVHLAHYWLAEDGHVAGWWDNFRITLPHTIAPDDRITVQATIQAPDEPGQYQLRWDLVLEGQFWFSQKGNEPLIVPITVKESQRPDWAVEWLAHETPSRLTAGVETRVGLRLRNTGRQAWPPRGAHPVHIGYHWYDEDGNPVPAIKDLRTTLPDEIPPGGEVSLRAALATPPQPGTYTLEWDLVQEGVAWFKEKGGTPLRVPVTIEATTRPTWTVRASHNPDDAPLVLDGNPATFWDSGARQAPGMWFEVDLGEPRLLDAVTFLSPGRGYPTGYRVKVSADGQTWAIVGERSFNWKDVYVPFDVRPVRFIRIEQTGSPTWDATWRISEIELREAPAWTARASHNPDDAHLAIDHNPKTFWSSEAPQTPGMWFQVDMGKIRRIDTVEVLSHENTFPLGYRVRLSRDGETWLTIQERRQNWKDLFVQFAPIEVRFIRIEQTAAAPDGRHWRISEIRTREAAPWQAKASHNPDAAPLAIDNRWLTQWSSNAPQTPGMWFMLDLGDLFAINALHIFNGDKPHHPRGFEILLSANGKDWKQAAEQPNNTGPISLAFAQPEVARFITIRQTAQASVPWDINWIIVERQPAI